MTQAKSRIHSGWLWLLAVALGAVTLWCTREAIAMSAMLQDTGYGLAMPQWASRLFLTWCVGAALSSFAMIAVLFQLLIRRLQRPSRLVTQRTESKPAGR